MLQGGLITIIGSMLDKTKMSACWQKTQIDQSPWGDFGATTEKAVSQVATDLASDSRGNQSRASADD